MLRLVLTKINASPSTAPLIPCPKKISSIAIPQPQKSQYATKRCRYCLESSEIGIQSTSTLSFIHRESPLRLVAERFGKIGSIILYINDR